MSDLVESTRRRIDRDLEAKKAAEAKQRRHLIARMAGNIAAGIAARSRPRDYVLPVEIAIEAVEIAREILEQVEKGES